MKNQVGQEKATPRAEPEKGLKSETQSLRNAIAWITQAAHPSSRWALPEQPFDRQLLALSPLYLRSRRAYLEAGGRFYPALISSSRSLASPTLLIQEIEYSPIERELIWAATDPAQAKDSKHLMELRGYTSSIFHEQSHRLLWRLLPPPPQSREGVRRYLNFAESLVIATDMALGDELGPEFARRFFLTGAIYDPGAEIKRLKLSKTNYRHYLHALAYATYLSLELYSDDGSEEAVARFFPLPGKLHDRVIARTRKLDPLFIAVTNPDWQELNWKKVAKGLTTGPKASHLDLEKDALRENGLAHFWGEKWFRQMKL
jgi:hypothetical protein